MPVSGSAKDQRRVEFMTKMISFGAALLFGTLTAGQAFAGSIVELGDTPAEEISSIVYLGDPDPCANGGCEAADEKPASDGASDSNAALVDIYGMPTNMPVIMRPSMDTPPAADVPAAEPAPAPAASTEPQQPKQEPAPVVEQPKQEPAPQPEQPAPEQPQPASPNGQMKME